MAAIKVTEGTPLAGPMSSQVIPGPAQTKAGDVGVSDMGWCLGQFRHRVTISLQSSFKGYQMILSIAHVVSLGQINLSTFHAVSGQNEEV